MKLKTSIALSEELIELADSIAAVEDRSRSYIIEKAAMPGLKKMDSEKAQAIRAKKGPAKKGKK